jgi:cysteine desulfurase
MAKKNRIYMDTAAGTPVDKRVIKAMLPYFDRDFGNPASIHGEGVAAAKALAAARAEIATHLGAHPDELIFTSGGTESNHLALQLSAGGWALVSVIEHPSILFSAPNLIKVPVDQSGVINLEEFKKLLNPDIKLVSVMMVNNEIGTIQPIKEIAKIIRHYRKTNNTIFPLFHTDACQATRALDLFIPRLGVDLLTLNAAKIYGPKGVGLLYAKRGINLKRSGTENVPGIIGLAEALKIASREKNKEAKRLTALRDFFIKELKKISGVIINGESGERAPHIINATFPNILAEQMVIELDAEGIAVSTGSACAIAERDESYVIMALGRSKEEAQSSVRFSLGRDITKEDLKSVIKAIHEVINKYVRDTIAKI